MLKRVALIASCIALVGALACVRPKPAPPPAPEPALEVPVIPPRVLSPLPPEPEEPPSPEPEPATRVTRRPPPRPTTTRPRTDTPANRETPGGTADPKPTETQPGSQEVPAEAKPEEPKTAVLKTPQTANEDESARRIREVMSRAQKELTRVNATALGRDARVQYDTARRFIDQAEDALKVKNYMFAGYLADKAEQLARGLQGR